MDDAARFFRLRPRLLPHPESAYFSVGATGEDQQEDFLQKAGLPALTSLSL